MSIIIIHIQHGILVITHTLIPLNFYKAQYNIKHRQFLGQAKTYQFGAYTLQPCSLAITIQPHGIKTCTTLSDHLWFSSFKTRQFCECLVADSTVIFMYSLIIIFLFWQKDRQCSLVACNKIILDVIQCQYNQEIFT